MSVTPEVLWAQRSSTEDASKNVIFLSVDVWDSSNVKVDLTATNLTFDADTTDSSTHYHLSIDFFDEIEPEKSKRSDSGKQINFILQKKTLKEEYWPRLTKEKLKYHFIKTDFDKWVDEDEQKEHEEADNQMMNDGDFSQFSGAGGAGGPGGMDFSQLLGGAGGAGGPGGMDFSQLLGGAGGAGGPGGNFDISALASQLGQAGANLDEGDDEDDEGDDEVEAEISTKDA